MFKSNEDSPGVLPNKEKKIVERDRARLAGVEFLKDFRYLAHHAAGELAVVSVGEEIIAQNWRVDQHLNNAIHEARIP